MEHTSLQKWFGSKVSFPSAESLKKTDWDMKLDKLPKPLLPVEVLVL
ncbi:MAG: hypothetical protein ACKPJQ_07990 [Dolichospermum sp.]